MRPSLMLFVVILCLAFPALADRVLQTPVSFVQDQEVVIGTHDGRELVYFIDRPELEGQLPLLLMIDGSGCIGQLREDWTDLYRPAQPRTSMKNYARVRVEKPGVDPSAFGQQETCSDDFLKHFTMDKRVEDHLRVLQHLRANADWWNGELYIWGWSDGGDIATRLVAYYPNVERAVLGAMGGGTTMASHFENLWICGDQSQIGAREACVTDLRANFQKMADNPTWMKTWSGVDNSWAVWASRLWSKTTDLLIDNRTPVLIVHGEDDFNAVPVSSARTLVKVLEEAGNEAFTYWEIAGMAHGTGSLPDELTDRVERAMLYWMLRGEVGVTPWRIDDLLTQANGEPHPETR